MGVREERVYECDFCKRVAGGTAAFIPAAWRWISTHWKAGEVGKKLSLMCSSCHHAVQAAMLNQNGKWPNALR